MNPYTELVSKYVHLLKDGHSLPLGGFPPAPRPNLRPDAPKALFFSPHPDDECISGGIAMRLLRDAKMNLINVAVTLGSKKERQHERYHELENACRYLGFGLIPTAPNGLEKINPRTRDEDKAHWSKCVKVITDILAEHEPRVVMFPHDNDWNGTHIGTHFLIMDALAQMPSGFECYLVETEFWGAMTDPNLMVEISADDLADMLAAISFHVGEVNRNPYHVLLPAWMLDNVRRGSEVVGGQGGAAPNFTFAALYRLRQWTHGHLVRFFEGGKQIGCATPIGELFP
jgi:N-acetylglucosamine malate deacetylase 1